MKMKKKKGKKSEYMQMLSSQPVKGLSSAEGMSPKKEMKNAKSIFAR